MKDQHEHSNQTGSMLQKFGSFLIHPSRPAETYQIPKGKFD